MNRRLGWILLLLGMGIQCAAAQADQGPGTDIAKILKQFPGYHLLTMAEREANARAFLVRHSSKSSPSIIHADFDGDGHPDYALLLKHKRDGKAEFVVLLCSGDANCTIVDQLDVTGSIAEMYIRPVATGSLVSQAEATEMQDDTPPVTPHRVGIQVNYFEKAAVVYYWEKKTRKIEQIESED
jgi:hypothetical protein